jgi:hypothetical protein
MHCENPFSQPVHLRNTCNALSSVKKNLHCTKFKMSSILQSAEKQPQMSPERSLEILSKPPKFLQHEHVEYTTFFIKKIKTVVNCTFKAAFSHYYQLYSLCYSHTQPDFEPGPYGIKTVSTRFHPHRPAS